MKLARIFIPLIAILVALLPNGVLAIDEPTSLPTIDVVNAYQSVIETNDQLYFVKFTIDYGDNYTALPTETASQAYLVRLLDNTTELGSVTPYTNPYHMKGYGEGIIGLYFSAASVTSKGMVWNSSNYTMYLEGNPALSWNATAPVVNSSITTWTSASAPTALQLRVLYLAQYFRSVWGLAYTLEDSGTLTSYGENYFTSTIPGLRTICSTIFSGYIVPAEFYERTFTLTYALTLRNQWLGTWLDLTPVGADWGIDAIWLYTMLWGAVIGAANFGIVYLAKNTKPIVYVSLLMVTFGGLVGFLPWLAAIIGGVIMVFMIVYQLLYNKVTA